ncbi:reverse transcriptase domain-containing protein [Serratia ureilytica]|uniref:reverse transcriptase domain-containing protein n=1 Tax=Serratia ureilytica TaxID=300181 RepID=UPI00235F39E1|nr:reverse transcriptase domain-containing protein [Serratia ureilytica]
MNLSQRFDSFFTREYLNKIYSEHVILSSATGVDNMTHEILWGMLDEQLDIINRKVTCSNYIFSKYKLKLISKGRGKSPREISIPTIRDKIALRALCDFLKFKYDDVLDFQLPQAIVRQVKNDVLSGEYNAFIKLDVANFYPSIKHDKLIRRLRARLRDDRIITLIINALKAPTVSKPNKSDALNERGVPQGLSISNILAAIFLSNLDKRLKSRSDIKYYRYVDDILIFCKIENVKMISEDLVQSFRKLSLKVYDPIKHPEKSSLGYLSQERFNYLGYNFSYDVVSARSGSVEKLRESLLAIFTGYKHSRLKSLEFLEWRLNLRITGCIFQNKSKGWMYFFSEINDEVLLHQLDAFLKNLCKRFNAQVKLKSFVRTYYQIQNNRQETKYIPNFDNYTLEEKIHVLSYYFKKNIENLTTREIEYHFKKRISRQVKDLETDVKDAGY